MIKEITKCRACGSKNLISLLSLGDLAVSDFVKNPNLDSGCVAPLELMMCEVDGGGCGLVQLKHTVPSEVMYRNYWYQSGINQTMTKELANIAKDASVIGKLKSGDIVIDIGSNDGTLLRSYDVKGLKTVGFEPALNLLSLGKQGTMHIIPDFFGKEAWVSAFGDSKARVITAIGMFYDLENPNQFLEDINYCLSDDGVFIIQMMYMPFALERNAFDGICHEHLEYYTILSLDNLLRRHDLEIVDVTIRENVNEGSLRIFIKKSGSKVSSLTGKENVDALRLKENQLKFNEKDAYFKFEKSIQLSKRKTMEFLESEKQQGKKIHGYAASTKGNTTLQYYGLSTDLIEVIADRNPNKWGTYTAGTAIPIVSEDVSRDEKPDIYLVLAWHFLAEFISREKAFLDRGGKFVVAMPEFRVIGRQQLDT
ncbi:class I SAM-dependent methyltransferase [bacterium]|nr:class I SAM-dependent methyltransferase [bacterium]